MIIRAATQADEPFLWAMLYESIHIEPGAPRPNRSILQEPSLAHYLSGWGRPGDRAFLAEAGGAPIGAAWYRLMPENDPGYGFVAADIPELGIALSPAARGGGVGTLLMEHLIAQARVDGYRGLSLSVDPRNAALRLYERLGFTYVGADEGGSWTMLLKLVA